MSQVYNFYPHRFMSLSFLAVPYAPPGRHLDLDRVQAMTENELGFERHGYIRFFLEEDSWELMDEHVSRAFCPKRSNTSPTRLEPGTPESRRNRLAD